MLSALVPATVMIGPADRDAISITTTTPASSQLSSELADKSFQSLRNELLISLLEYLDPVSTVCFALTSRSHLALVLSITKQPLKDLCLRPNQPNLLLSGSSDFEKLMHLLCAWLPRRHLQSSLLNDKASIPNRFEIGLYRCNRWNQHHYHGITLKPTHIPCFKRGCWCHLPRPKFYREYAEKVVEIEESLGLTEAKNSEAHRGWRKYAGLPGDAADARFEELAKAAFWEKGRWIT